MAGRLAKLKLVEDRQIRKDLPDFKVGDTIKMKVKVQEADKVRLHPWEGIVIGKRGTGIKETFTVRKVTFGEGVEKIFPIHSPVIESIKVTAKALKTADATLAKAQAALAAANAVAAPAPAFAK